MGEPGSTLGKTTKKAVDKSLRDWKRWQRKIDAKERKEAHARLDRELAKWAKSKR